MFFSKVVMCGSLIERGTPLYHELSGLGTGIWDVGDDDGCASPSHVVIFPDGRAFDLGPADKTRRLLHTGEGNGNHIPFESLVVIELHPFSYNISLDRATVEKIFL